MFEKEAKEYAIDAPPPFSVAREAFQKGAEFGYHEGFKDCAKSRLNVTTISDCPIKDEEESKYKTAYIKGIRTMANALKDYDRTDGAWTDYFEHTVEEVLKRLLQESK
jgi:hypothetical protein